MLTKQGLTEYVGKYHMRSSGMYGGNMRHTEPRYTDGPRDVCWGSGSVAWDDSVMFVPFPIVYTVDGCSTKLRHIGITDTRAEDQFKLGGVWYTWDLLNRDISRFHRVSDGDLGLSP